MKTNQLDTHSLPLILKRILNLSPASKGLWGNMTVNEMLFHCRKVNNEILQGVEQNIVPTVKQKIMKTVGLYLIKKFPKGVKTGPRYLPDSTENLQFEKMQNSLVDNIKEVSVYDKPIYGKHPFFGPLNTKEWRQFMWKHIDHHLRQFNV